MRHEILVAGFGGQGIVLAGYILGRAVAIYEERHAVLMQSYGPEARGGACSASVVLADEPVDYPYVRRPDVLILMSLEAAERYGPEAHAGSVVLYDRDLVPAPAGRAPAHAIPATRIAEKEGARMAANVVMLGFLAGRTGAAAPPRAERARLRGRTRVPGGGGGERMKPVDGNSVPRIGVYICKCGHNIGRVIDCAAVAEFAAGLEGVVHSSDNLYSCSEPGQVGMVDDIKKLNLERVVIAACSPRLHEPTFRAMLARAGLNPYLLEMANIREHCSWVHPNPEEATAKAKDLVRMAVARARLLKPQQSSTVPVRGAALVVGGGIAGIQASLDLADSGYRVFLVEKEPSIGGVMSQIDKTFPTMDCSI
ncbi:MAG: 2-oxoacid:acceptor oxidoreductase family protein [Planctomycetota bacterium]